MGLSVEYLYSLTPRQFRNIQIGFRRKQDQDFKDNWERTRMLMFTVLRPHMKSRTSTERDILIFPWEKEEGMEVVDLKNEILQVEENKKKWAERDAEKIKKAE